MIGGPHIKLENEKNITLLANVPEGSLTQTWYTVPWKKVGDLGGIRRRVLQRILLIEEGKTIEPGYLRLLSPWCRRERKTKQLETNLQVEAGLRNIAYWICR